MPGQLSPKGAISRQAILAAAYPLFPEKGYHGTSSRDMRGCILREAGIVRAQHRLQRIAAPPLAIVSLCQKWCLIEKESRRSRAWTKRLICSDPSSSLTARGCVRTPIPARSTSRSRTAMAGPAGGTRCAPYACWTGIQHETNADDTFSD
jgi:hypothetical protein